MNDPIAMLEWLVDAQQGIPTLAEMPRRTLSDKGIAGPTAAHVIEEIHTPLNLALVTFTTGSSAFQNIVGVTQNELLLRSAAGKRVLAECGVTAGQHMVVTYAPLVNVFTRQALDESGLHWSFLSRSCRDALLIALCRQQPDVVVGESSFLRATLEQALKMNLQAYLPKTLMLITAGTPLDEALVPLCASLGYGLHDVYGCQEFGWLILDGLPLREDISLVAAPQGGDWREVIVGGLPTGDSFPVATNGHLCNLQGKIQTWKRRRTTPEYDMVVMATTAITGKLWSGRHGRFYVSRGEFAGSVRSYKPKPAPPISASTPLLFQGRKRQKPRRSILSVRRPPRSLTPCLQHSGIYSNKRKTIRHGANSDERPATPYFVLAGER